MSAVLTVSLDGYLDDKRLSYGSPPDSDLTVESFPVFSPVPSIRHHDGSDPSAADQSVTIGGPHTIATNVAGTMLLITQPSSTATTPTTVTTTTTAASNTTPSSPPHAPELQQQQLLQPGRVQMRQHRRQSSINTVSWTDQGGDSSSLRPLSYNLDPSDVRLCFGCFCVCVSLVPPISV